MQTFRGNLSVPFSEVENPKGFGFSTPEDGTDRLSRNVGKELRNPDPFGFSVSENGTDKFSRNPNPFGFSAYENGTDRLSRNVDKKYPLLAA